MVSSPPKSCIVVPYLHFLVVIPAPTAASGWRGSDFAAEAVLVVCAIAGERSDGTVNLVEQGTNLRAIVSIVGGQCPGTRWINDRGGSELLRRRL